MLKTYLEPKDHNFFDTIFEVLAGIFTVGLAGCSSDYDRTPYVSKDVVAGGHNSIVFCAKPTDTSDDCFKMDTISSKLATCVKMTTSVGSDHCDKYLADVPSFVAGSDDFYNNCAFDLTKNREWPESTYLGCYEGKPYNGGKPYCVGGNLSVDKTAMTAELSLRISGLNCYASYSAPCSTTTCP